MKVPEEEVVVSAGLLAHPARRRPAVAAPPGRRPVTSPFEDIGGRPGSRTGTGRPGHAYSGRAASSAAPRVSGGGAVVNAATGPRDAGRRAGPGRGGTGASVSARPSPARPW